MSDFNYWDVKSGQKTQGVDLSRSLDAKSESSYHTVPLLVNYEGGEIGTRWFATMCKHKFTHGSCPAGCTPQSES